MLNTEDLKNNLFINQFVEETIQGEGNSVGITSTILRLSYCNLNCVFCDTKYSWKHPKSGIIIDKTNIDEFIEKINKLKTNNLMITGGEPLLYSNNDLFFKLLDNVTKSIEIETNGILLDKKLQNVFNVYKDLKLNISPKLDISYYKIKNDFNKLISNLSDIKLNNYIFKFVYGKNQEKRIFGFINKIQCVRKHKIYLMPYTPDVNLYSNLQDFRLDFIQSCKDTIKACINYGFKYSPRLQIDLFGFDKTEEL
jgi:7-carboxy-7-deazaguanine synthase